MAEGDPLDDLLRAAFEDEPKEGESVLDSIERMSGARPRILLRDVPDHETPVLRAQDERAADFVRGDRRYQIAGEIARGGIGVVLKGRDRNLGRSVALKVLRAEHVGNEEVVRRFIEEAQIGGQLQHPGIVPVFGMGLEGKGRPFFAMKLVKGQTLSALLEDRKSPADRLRRFVAVFEQVAQTMAYAHARGVVHRDLKPSNVMVGSFGEVQVVDWGLAKVLGHHGPEKPLETIISTVRSEGGEGSASLVGSVMGTPAYMPPEQALGHVDELDERSDVFALGAILCEILTGEPPYRGESRDQLIQAAQARLDDAWERLDLYSADDELVAVAKRCMKPLPGDRPRDAGVVAREIAANLAAAEQRARVAEVDAAEARANAAEARERETRERRRVLRERRVRRRTALGAAAVLLLVVAGGAGYAWKESADRERTDRANRAVAAALREVTRLAGAEAWDHALAEAGKAVALGDAHGADDATAEWAGTLLARAEEKKRAADDAARIAAEDEAMLARLDEVRLHDLGKHGYERQWRNMDATYAGAFQEIGIDVQLLGATEAARLVRTRSVPQELAVTRDECAALRRNRLKGRPWKELAEIARLADPDPWRDRLRRAVAAGDREELRNLAETADVDQLPAATAVLLGDSLSDAGLFGTAIELLRGAQRIHPNDFRMNFHLAQMLRRHSYSATERVGARDAARYYTAALALRPGHACLLQRLGATLVHAGNHEAARAYLLRSLASQPFHAYHYFGLSDLYVATGEYDQAHEACNSAAQADPKLTMVHGQRALVYRAEGNPGQAAAEARLNAELTGDGTAWVNYGALLLEARKIDEGIGACRRAAELAPNDPIPLCNIVTALTKVRRLEKALKEARAAVDRFPELAASHGCLAEVLYYLREYEESLAEFRRAVELNPADGRSWHAIAWILSVCMDEGRRDPTAAVHAAQRAVDLASKRNRHWHIASLGAALLRAGDPAAAANCLKEGIALQQKPSKVAEDRILLAIAQWKLGDKERARATLRRAVEWIDANQPKYTDCERLRAEAEALIQEEEK
jgi:serine/threonine-protein kinase